MAPSTASAELRTAESPTDSVILDSSAPQTYSSHGQVPKSDALRQPIIALNSRLKGSLEAWSDNAPLSQNIHQFLDFVAAHRLKHMPHKGSKWDKILQQVVFFAGQVHHYEEAVGETLLESSQAAAIIYGCVHATLELGSSYADALASAISVFHSMSTLLASFLRHSKSVRVTESMQQALANIFINMTILVVDMTLYYAQLESITVIDQSGFQAQFGQTIANLESHKDFLLNEIWRIRLEQTQGSAAVTYNIDQIRAFLSPFDSTVATLIKSVGFSQLRAEFTCEWFDSHLMSFVRSKDKNLVISGKSGIGKSVLTGWIVERLERIQGSKATTVISHKIQPDLVSETSSASIAKSLLLQLLDLNIGSAKFLKALNAALEMTHAGGSKADIEESLWLAVKEGFDNEQSVTIVIDGLDHVSGGQKTAMKVIERLKSITSGRQNLRSIVLTCPLGLSASADVKDYKLEPRMVQGDIRLFIRSLTQNSHQVSRLTEDERSKIIEQISVPADGSFLWAKITFATVTKQKTFSAIVKSLETTARGLEMALERLVFSLDLTHSDVRSLLAWMLAAERPLHLKEIKTLFELSPSEGRHTPRFSNVDDDVQKAIGDVVTVQNGYVRFIHTSVRSFLLNLAESVTDLSNTGKFPFMLKEANFDMATRCMTYLSVFFTRPAEPSVAPVAPDMMTDLFRDSPMLEYCVRYWATHVERSPMYAPDGKHRLVPTFKKNFTNSVFLPFLERSCWDMQFQSTRVMQMHTLALNLRTSVLGNEDPAVLQTMLTIASLHKKLDEITEECDSFFHAYELSVKIFGPQSKVTVNCAIGFLEATKNVKVTTRNTTSSRIETILLFVVNSVKSTGDTSPEDIIKYSTKLAELYTIIGEEDKAVTVWRNVYEMSVETYGSFDIQTTKTYNVLLTGLRKLNKHEEVAKVQRIAYDRSCKSLSVTDARRHELAIELIQLYETQKNTSAAEEILVDEWQSLTKAASTGQTNFHNEKLALSVQYSKFLRKNNRTSEAQNVLLGIWSEYKDRTDIRSETMMSTFTSMAQEMKQLELVETAQSILLSVWNETKTSTQQTSLTQIVATELIQTTQYIVNSKKEVLGSDMSIEESIMEDIAQTSSVSTTQSHESTADISFTTTDTLSTFYLHEERLTDAIRVCTKFLERSWPSVLQTTQSGKLSLPKKMRPEVVLIATRLAECHFNAGEAGSSERLLQNVFTASRNSLTYTDEQLISSSTTLIKFFESTHQYGKALTVHDEVFNLVKEKTGPSSEPTILAAEQCGKYCVSHNMRKEAEPYYVVMYISLSSKKSEVLSEDALGPAQWLEDFYRREKRWKEARPIYSKIWQTIVTCTKQYGITAEYISTFYSNYTVALKTRYDASYDQLRQVTAQFREVTVSSFGQESEIALKATYELAVISEQVEKHREESVQLYNSILAQADKKKTTTALSSHLLKIVRQTKSQVAQLYTTSTTTTTQAITIFSEEYQNSVTQNGYANQSTLEQQRNLVTTLSKESSSESKSRILEILQASVVSIISTEKDSQKLFGSATQIARAYLETGNEEAAITLLSKLRRFLVLGEQSKDLQIKLDRSDRTSYAFVAAFELAIYPSRQFSEIMSALMTESMRYEAYHKAIKDKASLITILLRGSQLLEYQQRAKQQKEYAHVRVEILRIFKTHLGVSAQDTQLHTFFDIVISHITQVEEKSTLLQIVVQKVAAELNASHFREAYELALLEAKFMELNNELSTSENVRHGFTLALYLSGRGAKRSEDADLAMSMLELSRKVLGLVIVASREQNVQFASMDLEEVNMLTGLLGQLKMYAELEPILTEVWTSRHIQQTWTSATVVNLGRRLIEVRFAAGRHDAAIHLCEDIIYNLRRVWGELDATTLVFWDLLAELLSTTANFHAAQNVHEEVLRQSVLAVEEGDISGDKAANVAATHLDLLKVAYQRAGGWSRDSKVYIELQSQLRDEFGKEAAWTKSTSAKDSVEKWTKSGAPKDNKGLWTQPSSWEFVRIEDSGSHRNNLRKISGLFASDVAGGAPKGGKTYGQEIQGAKAAVK